MTPHDTTMTAINPRRPRRRVLLVGATSLALVGAGTAVALAAAGHGSSTPRPHPAAVGTGHGLSLAPPTGCDAAPLTITLDGAVVSGGRERPFGSREVISQSQDGQVTITRGSTSTGVRGGTLRDLSATVLSDTGNTAASGSVEQYDAQSSDNGESVHLTIPRASLQKLPPGDYTVRLTFGQNPCSGTGNTGGGGTYVPITLVK